MQLAPRGLEAPPLCTALALGPWVHGSAPQSMNPQARTSCKERHTLRCLTGRAPESHSPLPAHLLPRPGEGEDWIGEKAQSCHQTTKSSCGPGTNPLAKQGTQHLLTRSQELQL